MSRTTPTRMVVRSDESQLRQAVAKVWAARVLRRAQDVPPVLPPVDLNLWDGPWDKQEAPPVSAGEASTDHNTFEECSGGCCTPR